MANSYLSKLSDPTVNITDFTFTVDRLNCMESTERSYWSEIVPWALPEASGTIGRAS